MQSFLLLAAVSLFPAPALCCKGELECYVGQNDEGKEPKVALQKTECPKACGTLIAKAKGHVLHDHKGNLIGQ